MIMKRCLMVALLALASSIGFDAQAQKSTAMHVKETAGIRRFVYPVNARVPFAKGVLANKIRCGRQVKSVPHSSKPIPQCRARTRQGPERQPFRPLLSYPSEINLRPELNVSP